MIRSQAVTYIACALSLAALVALGLDLATGWFLPRFGDLARLALLLIAALACGSGTLVWVRHWHKQRQVAQHQIDLLCRMSPSDWANEAQVATVLPALADDNPWGMPLASLRASLEGFGQQLQIVEQARLRAEVRAQRMAHDREQLTEILNGLAEPVLAVNHFDDLVLANPSATQLFRLPAELGREQGAAQLVRCQQLVDLLAETRRRKSPTHRSAEIEITDAAGQKHWFGASCRNLLGGEGSNHEHGAVAVLRDISGQKAVQKRHAEFVSSVSHEMKTPLAGIKAYAELLADGDASDVETREEFLEVINSQTERLRRLIDNLLNLARIEAGVVQVQKAPRSLNELVVEAVSVVQHLADQKHIKLASDLSEMYLGVLADRDMLLQAAINLLSNAIKYTPEGGRVTVRSRIEDSQVLLEVSDTGVGLSPEDQAKVFEKFYRVKKDEKMAQGTGLGLPLAKHIVEDVHGGRLTLESELGRGSTFRITLPGAAGRADAFSNKQETSAAAEA